jgi:hypothetical protein
MSLCARSVNEVDGGHMSMCKTPHLHVSDCGLSLQYECFNKTYIKYEIASPFIKTLYLQE